MRAAHFMLPWLRVRWAIALIVSGMHAMKNLPKFGEKSGSLYRAAPRAAPAAAEGLRRRDFCRMLATFAIVPPSAVIPFLRLPAGPERGYPVYEKAVAAVVPKAGFRSRIALRDSIRQLAEYNVIDRGKFFALARQRGVPPAELSMALGEPVETPLLVTEASAGYLVNLLWPLGLSNYMAVNASSPVNGDSLANFASTAGWTLGTAENGADYFNAFPIVPLTAEQEHLVLTVAKSTYRPCCDNSTFFQDCNHGSALLGLLQLGASQGLGEADLYREALAFNAFWYPDTYIKTAVFFEVFKQVAWDEIDAKEVMGFDYSALSSWRRNVEEPLAGRPGLIPPPEGGANCGA